MQTREFVSQVAGYVPKLDENAALDATLPTLETLCEHLPSDEALNLAAQLPRELSEVARAGGERAGSDARPISLAEFNDKVARRAAMTQDEAAECTRAVGLVLSEAVSRGELADVALSLPSELTPLISPQRGPG